MKYTLDNFYTSKEWRTFRDVVINDRISHDGFIYDEVTGKPIVKQYDIILHHMEFLTNDNVNDASISLNPDNIQIVSHRTHNYIHNKLGYKRREVYLVYGSPCSGKNTYIDSVMEPGDLLIDIDKIKQAITNRSTHILVPSLNPIVFGIRDYLYESIRLKRGRWNNCYIVGGFPLISERERICRMYGAREIFIDTPKEICLERLKRNPDGREIGEWSRFIEEWWRKYRPPQQIIH